MIKKSSLSRGQFFISLSIFAFGVYIAYQTRDIADTQGYEQLGPRLFPMLTGLALILLGAVLGWQTITGDWRDTPQEKKAHKCPDWKAFLIITGGVFVQMALVKILGFVIVTAVLFTTVAYAFGSRRVLRDALISLTLCAAAFLLFTRVLDLSLPASPLGII